MSESPLPGIILPRKTIKKLLKMKGLVPSRFIDNGVFFDAGEFKDHEESILDFFSDVCVRG